MKNNQTEKNSDFAKPSCDTRGPITIYQSIFNDTIRVHNAIITPIQVGCAQAKDFYGILRDDTGDNISHLNRMYGELTGHYWAWKNDQQSAYVGLFHYRRLFIFKPGFDSLVNYEGDRVVVARLNATSASSFGWSEAEIEAAVRGQDIILPPPFFVKTDGKSPRNCGEHFSRNHGDDNYREMLRLIEIYSPEHMGCAERFFSTDVMYLANMFIMRRDLFDAYSAWLFGFLDAVRENVDCMSLDKYQVRLPAFMAERLFNIYLMRLRDIDPTLKIREVPYILIQNTSPAPKPLSVISGKQRVVSVVSGFDDNYLPCFGACLASLAESSDPQSFYDIIVLADGVSKVNRDLLDAQIKAWPNCEIRYIDMSAEFDRPEAVHGHFTKATFFRLKLAELLPFHDRVIYLDPDTIVLEDIGKLSDIDVSEAYVAAVRDYTMQSQIATNFRVSNIFGGITRKEYWDEHLRLSSRAQQNYFNAGLMIFNLRKIREERLVERFERLFWSQRFDLLDQDILNKVFDGHIFALDQRWNIITQPADVMARLPFKLYEELLEARRNPAILHFAGWWLKPWKAEKIDFSEYFWLYARKSVFYEAIFQFYIRSCLLAEPIDRISEVNEQLDARLTKMEKANEQLTAKLAKVEEAVESPWRIFHLLRKRLRALLSCVGA